MMPKLIDYLNLLDQDANARDAHEQAPVMAMSEFGLSADEQRALLSGDKAQVAQLIGIGPDELPIPEVSQFINEADLQNSGLYANLLLVDKSVFQARTTVRNGASA